MLVRLKSVLILAYLALIVSAKAVLAQSVGAFLFVVSLTILSSSSLDSSTITFYFITVVASVPDRIVVV